MNREDPQESWRESLKGKSPEEIARIAEEIARANSEPEYSVWRLARRQIIGLVILWIVTLIILLLVPLLLR
ncbi:MAG: hypothetical protein NC911_11175 [Candidatus Omnitrophica bacterium]|nr:hypothetical protein [Candidatus Omnitrophota bacterium]